MSRQKRWDDLTPGQQAAVVAAGVAEVVLTVVALRDLARRPRPLVRGPKPLWLAGCFVQPVGPVAYLALGRRRG